MPIKVRIPTPLQKLTQNQGEVEVVGSSIKEALADLEKRYPGIKERLYDEKGGLRRFINFYVNEEDIRRATGSLGQHVDPLAGQGRRRARRVRRGALVHGALAIHVGPQPADLRGLADERAEIRACLADLEAVNAGSDPRLP